MKEVRLNSGAVRELEKCPTGIQGLDEVTFGGIPRGRPTLVAGSAGSGKTLLAIEFLVRGATEFNEPGAFMTFEETTDEIATNVLSLGFDLAGLMKAKKFAMDHVYIEPSEIEVTGEYDLEGIFIRLGAMIDEIGAKRVALDSVEVIFAGLRNDAIVRSELRRLFRWLKQKKVTAIITGEQGQGALTRHGLEEYVSDCVLFLDHRINNQVATRRLRVMKYRGSLHGTNEYPTLIDRNGLSVLPVSSLGLNYPVTEQRTSTGIPRLDTMLGGQGYYRGSSILVSGTAGTGKTSVAAAFANNTCQSGRKCVYFSYEESPDQIMRNMASVGYDLKKWKDKGLLFFQSNRPTLYGLEMHLATVHKTILEIDPAAVIMDPITNMTSIGDLSEVTSMLSRMIDFLKNKSITAMFTSLTSGGSPIEQSEAGISSLMDTWLLLRMIESNGERNRLIYIMKSRGMAHSNQMREFILSRDGVQLVDVYAGFGEVLTGTARIVQEAKDRAQSEAGRQEAERKRRELESDKTSLQMQIKNLQQKLQNVEDVLKADAAQEREKEETAESNRHELRLARKSD
jgi:circadian clock protein KaiC